MKPNVHTDFTGDWGYHGVLLFALSDIFTNALLQGTALPYSDANMRSKLVFVGLVILSALAPQAFANQNRVDKIRHLVADGGVHTQYEPNSAGAIREAIKAHYQAIRVNAVVAADGSIVLHDGFKLNRAKYQGVPEDCDIRNMTIEQLRQIQTRRRPQTILTLPRLLETFDMNSKIEGFTLFVDIKSEAKDPVERAAIVKAFAQAVADARSAVRVVLISEDWDLISYAGSVYRPLGLVVGGMFSRSQWMYRFGNVHNIAKIHAVNFVFLPKRLATKSNMQLWRRFNTVVNVTGVTSGLDAQELVSDGADRLVTNNPNRIQNEVSVASACQKVLRARGRL